MRATKKVVAAAALGAALAVGAIATPAFAIGQYTNGKITGKSWTVQQQPCPQTCAFTTSEVGATTISVQIVSGGTLVPGTKVTTSGSPATYSTSSSFYLPGGHHVGAGTSFNT